MPFRGVQPVAERCALCDGASRSECHRCARPLCDRHRHDRRTRCAACEEAFGATSARQGPLLPSAPPRWLQWTVGGVVCIGWLVIWPLAAYVLPLPDGWEPARLPLMLVALTMISMSAFPKRGASYLDPWIESLARSLQAGRRQRAVARGGRARRAAFLRERERAMLD